MKILITTEKYLLIVSDNEEVKNGDWTIVLKTNRIARCERDSHTTPLAKAVIPLSGFKKIIEHLPLNDEAILEGVLLLSELDVKGDVEKLAIKKALELYPNNQIPLGVFIR